MSTTLPNDHEARLFVTDCLDAIRKAETSEDTETVVEVGAMLWNFIEKSMSVLRRF